jgi:FAD:protein FMN transferase
MRACRSVAAAGLPVVMLLAGCGPAPAPRAIELSGPSMGTTWTLKIAPGPGGLTSAARADLDDAVRDTLTRIEALMSTWDPESELSRFNTSSSTAPFSVAPETFDVFRWAVTLGLETGGVLDITISPIVEAWGFGAAPARDVPAPGAEQIAALLEATGTRHLELDPEGQWVRKRRADVRCDLSALAPGYAADHVASLLARRGIADFLLDVGGELVARGHNVDGHPWQVAIERPGSGARRIARVVPLRNVAIATSGDYRNYREVNGTRVSHIIDPRDGRPIAHRLASATVVDTLAVRADALATALMVLGPEEGMALARRLDLAAMLLMRTDSGAFDERMTPRFEALVAGHGED